MAGHAGRSSHSDHKVRHSISQSIVDSGTVKPVYYTAIRLSRLSQNRIRLLTSDVRNAAFMQHPALNNAGLAIIALGRSHSALLLYANLGLSRALELRV